MTEWVGTPQLPLSYSCLTRVSSRHHTHYVKIFHVYIMTNRKDGTLYIGVTSDLVKRVYEHRIGAVAGFTQRYKLKKLVYFEEHETAQLAIQREKNLKHWPRAWKVELIENDNTDWDDLYDGIAGG